MLFNTYQFAIFFVIIYSFYLFLQNNFKWQNRVLLISSCIFYGAWDWRFLGIIFVSITTDFFCALKIHGTEDLKVRRRFLGLSLIVNLLILGFFKYFNFFTESLTIFLNHIGLPFHPVTLRIILPVGISFYTFKTMSYIIDVYRRELEPTRTYVDYALFVTYFPQLLAGPIMRAKTLLLQIAQPRTLNFEQLYEGCYLILWGLFQKMVVADNLGKLVDPVFAGTQSYNGLSVLLALYAFAFQIYCDFAGYSNIAQGLGKCMGFEIMVNFNLPYFSTNPREFWRRWHISLSSWLRDYLYIALGGNKKGTFRTYINLLLTMLLGGLWHGASWTFVFWGMYHATLLIIYRLFEPLFRKKRKGPFHDLFINKIWFFIKIISFFHLICLGWLFFRAESMAQVFRMLLSIFFNFQFINNCILCKEVAANLIFLLAILIPIEVIQYIKNDLLSVPKFPAWVRGVVYLAIVLLIIITGVKGGKEFIYFQF